MGILMVVIVCVSLFVVVPVSAQEVSFEKEYTYRASRIDSEGTARALALEQVKRLLLDEVATYLLAEIWLKDSNLTKDEVAMLTALILQPEIVDEKWDGKEYYLKARIKADSEKAWALLMNSVNTRNY